MWATFPAVLGAVTILVLIKLWRLGQRPKNYPPGPKTFPIIGNLHQMPQKDLHVVLKAMADLHGPIMGLKVGAMNMIVLSSPEAVKDLFDKRSSIYSNRIDTFVRNHGNGYTITEVDSNDLWRRERKMYHIALNSTSANKYLPYARFESKQLLFDLLNDPSNGDNHMLRYTVSMGSTISYGWRVASPHNKIVEAMFEWIEGYTAIANSAQITEAFPILRYPFSYLPSFMSPLKKEIERLNTKESNIWTSQLEVVKNKIDQGTLNPCFAGDMLRYAEKEGLSYMEMAYNAGQGWAAAADTSYNTLRGFTKAMVLHPEVQEEAHRELDSVIGIHRLPDWEDWGSLPYIRSIMKETLRWCPPTLLGIPHSNSKEDQYNGMVLPKGSAIFANAWAINNDAKRYPEPRIFNPKRYLEDYSHSAESAAKPNPMERDHFTFGSGRRICAGMHVADRNVFLAIARILWAFRLKGASDENGVPYPIERDAMTSGFVSGPAQFRYNMIPRDEKRAEIIREEYKLSCSKLDEYGNYSQEWYQEEFWKNK